MTEDRRKQNIPVHRERREQDSLEVKTSFGSIRAGGGQMVLIIAIAALCGGLGYQGWMHDQGGKDRSAIIVGELKALTEAIKVQNYLSTLSQGEREKWRLDVPDSLRRP